jgi:type VI protein secretion system component VasA
MQNGSENTKLSLLKNVLADPKSLPQCSTLSISAMCNTKDLADRILKNEEFVSK